MPTMDFHVRIQVLCSIVELFVPGFFNGLLLENRVACRICLCHAVRFTSKKLLVIRGGLSKEAQLI